VCKRNELFAVQLWTEKGSDLIEGAAETRGGGEGFEPACGPVALLDAPMVLLDIVVQVAVRPVRHLVPEDGPNSPRVGVVASVVMRSGVTPVTVHAERKKASAAARSRVSLRRMSTRWPSRSIAR
jgi:hypothetical protein